MNVQQAAARWGISKKTVYRYCNENIIPEAYKENRKWIIPEIDKPPANRNGLVKYLKEIEIIKEGAEPKFFNNIETVKEIYTYLSDCGFITKLIINEDDIVASLKEVSITSAGKKLIESSELNPKKERAVTFKIPFGPIFTEISSKSSSN